MGAAACSCIGTEIWNGKLGFNSNIYLKAKYSCLETKKDYSEYSTESVKILREPTLSIHAPLDTKTDPIPYSKPPLAWSHFGKDLIISNKMQVIGNGLIVYHYHVRHYFITMYIKYDAFKQMTLMMEFEAMVLSHGEMFWHRDSFLTL